MAALVDAARGEAGGPRLVLLGVLTLIVLLVGQLSWQSLKSSREAYLERANQVVENLVAGLAATLNAEIAQVDTLLRAVVLDVERGSGLEARPAELPALLAQRKRLLPQIAGLRLVRADGSVIGPPEEQPINLADREYFVRARDDATGGLIVSEPVVSRIGQGWVIVLVRRLSAPDGSFGGVVAASLSTDHLQNLLADVEIGRLGAITLRTASLRLVARRTGGADGAVPPVGSQAVSEQLRQVMAGSPERGGFTSRTAIDGIERINRFRRVGSHPLVVLAGLAVDDYMMPWRRQVALMLTLDLVLLLVLAVSSVVLWRAWSRASASARQAERAARRYQALMHTASDGIHVLDRSGRIVDLSEVFAGMLGHPREAMLGKPVSDWDVQFTRAELDESMRAYRVGVREDFVTRHRRADGTLIDVEVSSVGVDIDGRELLYCSARDITQRRRAEQALVELAQEQALRAQAERYGQQLDTLLRERSDMLDVLAHEIRQPLHNASSAMESASSAFGVAGAEGFRDPVLRAQAVLLEVQRSLDNTLAVAALLARPDPIHVADADVDTLVRLAIADMPVGQRDSIRIERESTTRTVLMDMSLMRLALRNLLSNALKFIPEGAAVRVRIADSDAPLGLLIDVIDSGPGVAPELQERLFGRGARGRNRQAGHGLGLYIVKQVMTLHQGSAELVRTGPGGTTFRLTIVQELADP